MHKKTVLLTLFFLMSCGGNTFLVNPKYKNKHNYSKSRLLIFGLSKNVIEVDNKDDVVDDFNVKIESVDSTIHNIMTETLSNSTKKYLKNITLDKKSFQELDFTIDKSNYFTKNLEEKKTYRKKDGKEMKDYILPTQSFLTSNKIDAEFIMYISKIKFHRGLLGGAGVSVNTNGSVGVSVPTGALFAEVEYIVWDTTNNLEVVYGSTQLEETFAFYTLKKSNWVNMFKDISKTLYKSTPFSK